MTLTHENQYQSDLCRVPPGSGRVLRRITQNIKVLRQNRPRICLDRRSWSSEFIFLARFSSNDLNPRKKIPVWPPWGVPNANDCGGVLQRITQNIKVSRQDRPLICLDRRSWSSEFIFLARFSRNDLNPRKKIPPWGVPHGNDWVLPISNLKWNQD